ncbi:hypothetical protein ACXWPL_09640, partial [Streptococcus pyogenes]
VRGRETTRRDFLAWIRLTLEDIHHSLQGIQAEACVPIPNHPKNETISYEYLLGMEQRGNFSFTPAGMYDPIDVRLLLSGVDPGR